MSDEIEVTLEMTEAGVDELRKYDLENITRYEIAEVVYRAMEKARRAAVAKEAEAELEKLDNCKHEWRLIEGFPGFRGCEKCKSWISI